MSVAIVIGVWWAGNINQTAFASILWPLSGLIICLVVMARRYLYLLPFIFLAGIMIGLWRGSARLEAISPIRPLIGQVVEVSGRVSDDVDKDIRGGLSLRLADFEISQQEIEGKLWVAMADSNVEIKRGDIVMVRSVLSTGFGGFSASMYDAELTRWQRPQPGDLALTIRDQFAGAVRQVIDEPQASLGVGYLVGQRRALPEELALSLQIVGLTHVVVASGYNLMILVRLARRLLEKVSKYLATLTASLMVIVFLAVAGASPSMSRAGLVAGLSLAAWYYGRRFHPLVLLPLAAAVTALIDPSYAWGDLGWQLSFAAFAGVMVLGPLIENYFFGDRPASSIRQVFIETMSAFIMTAPILAAAFGQLSNVAIIANVLVLPLVPAAMVLTFLAGLGAVAVPFAASILAWPASVLLTYMTEVARGLAALPWAMREVSFGSVMVLASYLIIVATAIYLWRATRLDLATSNPVV